MMTPGTGTTKKWRKYPQPGRHHFVFKRTSKKPTPPYISTGKKVVEFHPNLGGTWSKDPENILYWCYSATRARVYVQARTRRNED